MYIKIKNIFTETDIWFELLYIYLLQVQVQSEIKIIKRLTF